jgi:hypothetical protein
MDFADKMYRNSRLTSMTYLNGKVLNYDYASAENSDALRNHHPSIKFGRTYAGLRTRPPRGARSGSVSLIDASLP